MLSEDFLAHVEAVVQIEAADEFAGELHVGDLVLADRDKKAFAGFGVHDDIGGLESGVPEETISVEIFVLDVFELLFVGGNTFEPAEGRDHGEKKVEFGVLGDKGLQKDHRLRGVKTGCKEVNGNLQRIVGNGGGVRVVAREGMPVGDEVVAVLVGIALQRNPVLQRAKEVTNVKTACGAHAG